MLEVSLIHKFNIFAHVAFGVVCIVFGLLMVLLPKGNMQHKRNGKYFVAFASVSIGAALIGAIIFRSKIDLLAVSFLVAYHIYSGPRALNLKNRGRNLADFIPAIFIFLIGIALYYGYKAGLQVHWLGAKIIATAGGLVFYGGWDCLRTLFPISSRMRLNIAEHAVKMVSIVGALLSVGAATLMKTESAYIPLAISAIFGILALGFGIISWINPARYSVGVKSHDALNARLKVESEL